jgi:hypothetical protein
MTITLDIKPEVQAELERQAAVQGRPVEAFAAALLEDAIQTPIQQPAGVVVEVVEACEQLKTFGKRHGLSLGGTTLRELRHEARP